MLNNKTQYYCLLFISALLLMEKYNTNQTEKQAICKLSYSHNFYYKTFPKSLNCFDSPGRKVDEHEIQAK